MKSLILALIALCSTQIALAAPATDDDATTTSELTTKAETPYTPSASILSRVIPELSLNVNTVVGDGVTSADNKVNYSIGAVVDIGHSALVFDTGLLYRQLGAKRGSDGGTVDLSLNYLSVPLLAKFYFSGQSASSLYLQGGLLPSILVSQKMEFEGTDLGDPGATTFDLQAEVGLGGKIPLSARTDFFVEADYFRSLTNINSHSGDGGINIYNSGAALTAGIGINL